MNPAPLILLHGALGASAQLLPLAARLGERRKVYLLDFEGHGTSPASSRPFRMDVFSENVLRLMDGERIARADFFGYSLGGYVALTLALSHPDRVEGVATLGTKFHWTPEVAARDAKRLDPAVIRAKVPAFAATLEARHASAGGWEVVLEKTADLLRTLGAEPPLTQGVLAGIQQPVQLIVGDRDDTVTADETQEVAGWLPNGVPHVLPDTPHPIEKVDVFRLATVVESALA